MRRKRIIKNVTSSLLLQVITVLCGFIVPKLIIETYGSDTNGLISSISKFLGYIVLLESGFGPVIKSLMYKPIAKKNKEELERVLKSSESFFRKVAKIFIAYIIILCVVYPLFINKEFDRIYTISLILIISISTFSEYFFGITYKIYLQAEQKAYITSYIEVFATILNACLVILLVTLKCDIRIVKMVTVLVFLLRPILQNVYVKKKYNINFKNAKPLDNIEQKWDGMAQHIASVIHENTDVVVLTIFTNLKEVSVYSIYFLVVSGIRSFSQSFSSGVDASWGDMIAKKEYDNLNNKFNTYKILYDLIVTIIFICTFVLIVPFVQVYTRNITDYNYIRPLFGYLLVLAEFVWVIRQPYNDLIKAAGHFKQTRRGAILEAVINICLSIILVSQFGLVGVAIGTLVAMSFRMVNFINYSSKNILKVSPWKQYIRLFLIAIEFAIVFFAFRFIENVNFTSYIIWFKYGVLVALGTTIVVLVINSIVYRKVLKNIINIIKNKIHK